MLPPPMRLVYANRLPALVDALIEHTRAERRAQRKSPLEQTVVLRGDRTTGAYLRLALARQGGIAAREQLLPMSRFIVERVEAASGGRVATAGRVERALLRIFSGLAKAPDPELSEVQAYLSASGADDGRRAAELAAELARVFDGYQATRPDQLEGWARGEACAPGSVERWQARLWRRLGAEAGLSSMFSLVRALEPEALSLPADLHLFDLAPLGLTMQAVLSKLAARCRLYLYAQNPCLEFWEDLQLGWSPDVEAALPPRADAKSADAAGEEALYLDLDRPSDPPLLRLWGKPHRESIRMLNQLSGCDFEARFVPPEGSGVLGLLQADVLLRAPERSQAILQEDDSLQIWRMRSPVREAERIAEEIWRRVEADAPAPGEAPLCFSDFCVALSGREQAKYRAHLAAALSDHHKIPFSFLDVPMAESSRVLDALSLMLALPGSRYTRQDLLRLLIHPNFFPAEGEATPEEWLGWCEALQIFSGASRRDHAGSYLSRDLYNWDQGLVRLTLGAFMGEDAPAIELDGEPYLPLGVGADRLDSAAALLSSARELLADMRFAETRRLRLGDWCALVGQWLSAYLWAEPGGEDERDLLRAHESLQELAEEARADPDEASAELPFSAAAALIRGRLRRVRRDRGPPLVEGVVIAPLSRVASLPFRVVFMPGLGEGRFPAAERSSQLDLRRSERRAGDVSPRQRDLSAFLARLLNTAQAVHLSYVAEHPAAPEPLEPSSTLSVLSQVLERGYWGPASPLADHPQAQAAFSFEEAPAEPDSQPKLRPSVATQRRARTEALREQLDKKVHGRLPSLPELKAHLPAREWAQLSDWLHLPELPERPPKLSGSLRLSTLRRFLTDPAAAWAEHVLGWRPEPEDLLRAEHEAFELSDRLTRALLERVLLCALAPEAPALPTVYAQESERLRLSGDLPAGVFGDAQESLHMKTLRGWTQALRAATAGAAPPIHRLRFGPAAAGPLASYASEPRPAIPLSLPGGATIELRGQTELCLPQGQGSVRLLKKPSPQGAQARADELPGFIDMAARAAAGEGFERPYALHLLYEDGGQRAAAFQPFEPAEAQVYLGQLAAELRGEIHAYQLSMQEIMQVEAGKRPRPKRPRWRPRGPLSRLPPLSKEELQRLIKGRYAPYFSRRQELSSI